MFDRWETFRDCRTTITQSSLKFKLCVPFIVDFMDLQILKIGCVNYARFPNLITYCVDSLIYI